MPWEPEESLARLEADVLRSEARAAKMPAFEAALAGIRGSASSPGRDIRVEVDSAGRVLELRLSEQALGRGAQRLAVEVLSVIRAAESDSRQSTLAAVSALLGEDDPVVQQLRNPEATP